MRDSEPTWQYDGVPPRSWAWYVAHDEGLGCPAEKYVQLTPNGLAYTGNCYHPNWGGAYTIGFQTVEAFLAQGALSEDMPAEIAAAIRAHLEANRRPGPSTVLVVVAVLAADEPRRLARVDCHLDGVWLATPPIDEAGAEATRAHTLFRGAVAAGAHTVSAAFTLTAGLPRVAYAAEGRVDVEVGTTREVRLVLEPGTDRITLET